LHYIIDSRAKRSPRPCGRRRRREEEEEGGKQVKVLKTEPYTRGEEQKMFIHLIVELYSLKP